LTVRLPSRVVTTTFDTRGLSRNVRVSVLTPFSFVVVISELSGAAVVAGLVIAVPVFAFALEFAVLSLFVQLQVNKPNAPTAIAIKDFLLTEFPPSTPQTYLEWQCTCHPSAAFFPFERD
jgi:hypothetical protein